MNEHVQRGTGSARLITLRFLCFSHLLRHPPSFFFSGETGLKIGFLAYPKIAVWVHCAPVTKTGSVGATD